MEVIRIKTVDLVLNDDNPRYITEEKFKRLCKSIREFPEMLEARPIVADDDNLVLGGNMRVRACLHEGVEFVPVSVAVGWSNEQKREFIIKDNVGFGEWDWDILANEWDKEVLVDWGLEVKEIKETEKLSKLEYEAIYYEPLEIPKLKLEECIDTTKFDAKIKALEDLKLTRKQKDILRVFAYRFLKIDFEMVANYYSFQASEEEQKAIERLRLVLTDNGLEGFIEDDMLRVLQIIENDHDHD